MSSRSTLVLLAVILIVGLGLLWQNHASQTRVRELQQRVDELTASRNAAGYPGWPGGASQPAAPPGYGSAPASGMSDYAPGAYARRATVYLSTGDTHYHRQGCRLLGERAIATTLAGAQARGYTPCSECNP
jgi:hypothetical protein